MRKGSLRFGGILDRYVARLFALSYLAAFLLVVGLFLIVDMAANLDDYLRPDSRDVTPSSIDVARYYLLHMPFLYLQMSPYVTMVAGMFTVAKLSRFNEVVAALNAGISARRLVLPVFLGAGLLAAGMFALREWATAELGVRRDAIKDRLELRRPAPIYESFRVHDSEGRTVWLGEYHPAPLEGGVPEIHKLSIHYVDDQGRGISVAAEVAHPLEDGRWALTDGKRRVSDDQAQSVTAIDALEEIRFTPEDIELAWKGRQRAMDLSFSESLELLRRDPTNVQYRTLLQHHLTFPLAGLVLLGVGLPSVLRQERGKAGERIAVGFFLCVAFFGMEFITRTLGLQGQLGPLHAGWLPVLGFGALAVVLIGTMRS